MTFRKFMHAFPRWRAKARDKRGNTAVEFGILFPTMLFMFVGLMEFSVYFWLDAVLENAALHASRYGITGNTNSGMTREESITAAIQEHTYNMVKISDLTMSQTVYDSFSDIGQPEPYADANLNGQYDAGETFTDVNGNSVWDSDLGTAGAGGAADIVVYNIEFTSSGITGLLSPVLDNMKHKAVVAVRNEPF